MDEADKKKFQNAYDDASPAAQEKIQAAGGHVVTIADEQKAEG